MARKIDVQTKLLEEILAELRRLNMNLERRASPQKTLTEERAGDDSEDMDEFE